MKYYLIAGEASGDLHGANLMKALLEVDKEAQFRFFGGDLMAQYGGQPVKHYREMAFMGLYEVLINIRTISKNMNLCKNDITDYQPDVIILIDYPGFNLRIAEYATSIGIKVFYYISPKIWAWKESRIHKIKKFVDRMFVIFPFEVEFYRKHKYPVDFAGNPLLDAIEKARKNQTFENFVKENNLDNRPIIALLAGSRKQEIKRLLPEMTAITEYFPEYQFVIAGAPSLEKEYYEQYILNRQNVKLLFSKTYEILQHSTAAVVTSGTATLETALFRVPEVVVYKTSPATFHVGKFFVDLKKFKFFSLVNLVMQKEVVKELLQFDLQQNIRTELTRILFDQNYRQNMLDDYDVLNQKLGGAGASLRFAKLMFNYLNES